MLLIVNPAVRSEAERAAATGERVPRRVWLGPRMVAVLVIAAGAVFILAGTEVAIVAELRSTDQLAYTGVVVGVWSAVSAIGGIVYGALPRSPGQVTLMALLGLLTVPIGVLSGEWWLLALALVPASALCAPTIAATGEEVARLAPAPARGEAIGHAVVGVHPGRGGRRTAGRLRGGPLVAGVGVRGRGPGRDRGGRGGWVADRAATPHHSTHDPGALNGLSTGAIHTVHRPPPPARAADRPREEGREVPVSSQHSGRRSTAAMRHAGEPARSAIANADARGPPCAMSSIVTSSRPAVEVPDIPIGPAGPPIFQACAASASAIS